MKPSARLLACLLAPLVGSRPGEQRIVFAPAPDTRLERRFESRAEFGLDDFSLLVDGEDIGAVMGSLDCSVTTENRVEVADRLVQVADGRAVELLRTFDALGATVSVSFSSEVASHDQDIDCTSELEGTTVRFLWDPKKEGYQIAYEDGETDQLLAGLSEDMDCRALLPGKPVAEGDSWEVTLAELQSLASPGGDLLILPEGTDTGEMQEVQDLFREEFESLAEQLEGSCTCTYEGQSKEQPELARIALALELTADLDLADAIREAMELAMSQAGEDEMPDIQITTAVVTVDFEGTGVLLWDVKRNRMASLEVSGDASFSMDFSVSVDVVDESHDADLFLEMTGSMRHSLSAGE